MGSSCLIPWVSMASLLVEVDLITMGRFFPCLGGGFIGGCIVDQICKWVAHNSCSFRSGVE